ncbi:MAG TPA: hypothetical protein VMU60_08375 [Syntrophobacteria bacterium]|nr:hypothetical protein [Syntrophobacteria bacterium]
MRPVSIAIFWLMVLGFILDGDLTLSTTAQSNSPFDRIPITLQAGDVLPKALLNGPNYRVQPQVKNDGVMNTYSLETSEGTLRVESTAYLLMRIAELNAIQKLKEMEKTEVFKDALVKSGKAPITTAKGLVTEPVETVKGVATGIGNWFTDVGRSITSDDPHQPGVLSTAVGYASVKRAFAYDLGVDPYSDYEPLQDQLSAIARVAFAGGLTPKLAFAALQKAAPTTSMVLRVTSTANSMRELVRDKAPAELESINDEKLKAMGVPDDIRKEFLRNPAFNPQEETLLVGELDSMKSVSGRELIIATAAEITQPSIARQRRLQVQMMSQYVAAEKRPAHIVILSGSPFLLTHEGLIGLAPLDHVAWTPALQRKVDAVQAALDGMAGTKGKHLWIEGDFTVAAREKLKALGWQVREKTGMIWSFQ